MTEEQRPNNILKLTPRVGDLEQTIHGLAEKSENVSWSIHALERMVERDITDLQILRVLRTGMIESEIEAGKNPGEWKCKMVAEIRGRREVGVVTICNNGQRLYVKTVEWEDMR
ncbi:MAG: DUF4258 domain-containing protein [Gammaproteobacteria bacterium]|nr:DUF4258 domain-containing protein [Gammaproteobacteria bacterium]